MISPMTTTPPRVARALPSSVLLGSSGFRVGSVALVSLRGETMVRPCFSFFQNRSLMRPLGCVRLWDPLQAKENKWDPVQGKMEKKEIGLVLAQADSDIACFSLGDPFKGEHRLVVYVLNVCLGIELTSFQR